MCRLPRAQRQLGLPQRTRTLEMKPGVVLMAELSLLVSTTNFGELTNIFWNMTWIVLSFVITRTSVQDMMPFVFLGKSLKADEVKYYRLHEYEGLDWSITAE